MYTRPLDGLFKNEKVKIRIVAKGNISRVVEFESIEQAKLALNDSMRRGLITSWHKVVEKWKS